MTLRLALAGAALTAGIAAPSATAAPDPWPFCLGAQGTLVACVDSREVARQCLYLGSPTCRLVVVNAPLCVYGGIGSTGHFQTVWC